MSVEAGRNQPCPCGSGKKHKMCCLEKKEPSAAERASALLRLDAQLFEWMLAYAEGRFARVAVEDLPFQASDEETFFGTIVPWLLYFRREARGSVAEAYLRDRGGKLNSRQRAWIEASMGARFSFWEIREVDRGVSLRLRDLLTGDERLVHDQREAVESALLCARVVDADGVSVLASLHPRAMDPELIDELLDGAHQELECETVPVPHEVVREHAAGLLALWEELADLDELTNDDGDLRSDTFDRYTLRSREALLTKLEANLPRSEDDETVFMMPREDGAIIGFIRVDSSGVELESDSVERADAVRARFEALAGDTVTFLARESSIDEFPDPDDQSRDK